jgi:uncharacterized lipoprotein
MRIPPLFPAAVVLGLAGCSEPTTSQTEQQPNFDQHQACPDFFQPAPAMVLANGQKVDKNQNGLICVKTQPGGDYHATDDKIS